MNQLSKTRVLVMHSEHLVDAGLAATLSRHTEIEILKPYTATSMGGVMDWLRMQRPDVLITDYDRGLSLSEELHSTQSPCRPLHTHLMVVTSRTTQSEIRAALKCGIEAYLASTSHSGEIMDAVRSVQTGVRYVSEHLARSLLDDLLSEQLTPRETEVLRLAAQGHANKVIASRLEVEVGTVKCHMRSVLDKLSAGNRTEAVVIAHQRGLLALAPDPLPARANFSSQPQVRRPATNALEPLFC
jgi:DNA-binding NarL/FixJ family response regulator